MKKLLAVILCLYTLTLHSCYQSNAISFEINEQSIKSSNNKGIEHLYIKNDSASETYSILWTNEIKNAPKNVTLSFRDTSYKIFKGWNNKQILNTDFKLNPHSKYIIERVQGDASAYKIQVWTDENGNVFKVS